MPDPLMVLSSELRIIDVNPSFERHFRITSKQAIGRSIEELGNGSRSPAPLLALMAQTAREGTEFNDFELDHEFTTIGRRTILISGRQIGKGDSDGLSVLLSFHDITDRRLAERELSRQRTWFQTTLGSIGDAVIATDAQTRVTYLNPTAVAMTGWQPADAIGTSLHEVFNIVNEDTRKTVESPVTKAIRMGAIVGLANHTILIAKDGTERPIDDSAAPIRDEGSNDIIGVVMVFHDITERRAAEQKIEISEERYRRLFEAAHDGILILDAETRRITDVNPFLLELLDFPRSHFLGKELWEIGIFKDKQANQLAMDELVNRGSVRYESLPLRDRNGRGHPVEVVANLYREGERMVIQCNIRDISERVQFEREREAMLSSEQASRLEAESANRSKDIFLATLSHEVRTPLNAILGWTSILRSPGCTAEDLKEGMAVIERNCRVQVQLIDDVLDVSRIVSGKMNIDLRPCELIEVIHAAIDVLRPAADAKTIRIEASLDPAASRAVCDKRRMQQVVWNLLSNAVKFSAENSTIQIALKLERSMAKIQVIDAGQGITPEFLPFAFERFRQADSTTRRKVGGLGLGLSIVKHIVEAHGGTVWAESAGLGKGATFTVLQPLSVVGATEIIDSSIGTGDSPAANAAFRLDGLRVLIVDDEADARRLLQKVLGDVGAEVIAASSAQQAIDSVNAAVPDILVSDIAMPGRDGYDLIRQVRAAGHTARVLPAIALTAFANKDDRRRAILAGYQVHAAKPIDPHELIAIIAGLAGRVG